MKRMAECPTNKHTNTPRKGVGQEGKLGSFERHLLTRVSWHFAFFTTDGKSAVNQLWSSVQPITDL
jgi:hypothetical protein